jgi:hypothetical protein
MNQRNNTRKAFHYKNVEHRHTSSGQRMTRKVHIKGGNGHKSVCFYKYGGKKVFSVKKALTKEELEMIKHGKFIPGLFSSCYKKRTGMTRTKTKTRKLRR